MGPYCQFCGRRCFVPFPEGTPPRVRKAYKTVTIIATCERGQALEREQVGFCYDEIKRMAGAVPGLPFDAAPPAAGAK
jgi:hypothetical protein